MYNFEYKSTMQEQVIADLLTYHKKLSISLLRIIFLKSGEKCENLIMRFKNCKSHGEYTKSHDKLTKFHGELWKSHYEILNLIEKLKISQWDL